MRKVLSLLAVFAFVFCSCSEEKVNDPYVIKYAKSLVSQYPNYASNEMAKDAINDSIINHSRSFIGKDARDLDDIVFSFDDLLDGKDGKCAIFVSSTNFSIDAPSNSSDKYISPFVKIIAFGRIDNNIAAKLDKNCKYKVSGKLHEWDGENNLNVLMSSMSDDLDFGTYILDDMTITEITNE